MDAYSIAYTGRDDTGPRTQQITVVPPRRTYPQFHQRGGSDGYAAGAPKQHHQQRRRDNGKTSPHSSNSSNFSGGSSSKATSRRRAGSLHSGERILSRKIGALILVFAAQAVSGMGALTTGLLSTEVMADTYGFAERPYTSAGGAGCQHDFCYSAYSSAPADKYVPFMDPNDGALTSSSSDSQETDETDDERERRLRAASDGDDDDDHLSILSHPQRLARGRFMKADDVWEHVLAFLPWHDALTVRGVSRQMFHRSLNFAAVLRMPFTRAPAVFTPCRVDLDAEEAATEARYAPGAAAAAGGQRMFFGQLRRSGTVRMVEWLVNHVLDAPQGSLVSVENRRNPTTGRGKGCAWPTIRDDATVNRLLLAHHRLFFDRVGGVEGVWLVPRGEEAVLREETNAPRRGGRNHLEHMPRGVMVMEMPSDQQPRRQQQQQQQPHQQATAARTVSGGGNFFPAPRSAGARAAAMNNNIKNKGSKGSNNNFNGNSVNAALSNLHHHHDGSGAIAAATGVAAGSFALSAAAREFVSTAAHHPTAFTPYYDSKAGVVYTQPGVYRHDPYSHSIFSL